MVGLFAETRAPQDDAIGNLRLRDGEVSWMCLHARRKCLLRERARLLITTRQGSQGITDEDVEETPAKYGVIKRKPSQALI